MSEAPGVNTSISGESNYSLMFLIRCEFCIDIESFLTALDTEPVKELGDAETRLGVRDRRKGRKERRSTGMVQLAGEVSYKHS